MSTIGSVPLPTFQTVPTHSPLGKPAVGLESVIDKDSPLPPIEESAEAAELRHRDVLAKSRDATDSGGGRKQAGGEQAGGDQAGDEQSAADQQQSARETALEQALETQLKVAAQTAPALSPILAPTPVTATYQARHLGEFEPHILPPGSLLDQKV